MLIKIFGFVVIPALLLFLAYVAYKAGYQKAELDRDIKEIERDIKTIIELNNMIDKLKL